MIRLPAALAATMIAPVSVAVAAQVTEATLTVISAPARLLLLGVAAIGRRRQS